MKGEVGRWRGLWDSCWGHRGKFERKWWEAGERSSRRQTEGWASAILSISSKWMSRELRWEIKQHLPLYLASWGRIKREVQKWQVTTSRLALEVKEKIKGKPALTLDKWVTMGVSSTFHWTGAPRAMRGELKLERKVRMRKGWIRTGRRELSMLECSRNPRLWRLRQWESCELQVNLGNR